MARKKTAELTRKQSKKLVSASRKSSKKKYTPKENKFVAHELLELAQGRLTESKNGGRLITNKAQAVRKGLSRAQKSESKGRKKKITIDLKKKRKVAD